MLPLGIVSAWELACGYVVMLVSIKFVATPHPQMKSPAKAGYFGCDKNSRSGQITVIDVGLYSQKHWNRSSWKAGQSRMIWALSSFASWHRRHFESTAGSTFDLWYFRKLWPVRCLMHNPRSFRLKRNSSLESFGLGSGKNIFDCLQWSELSHLAFHFSIVSCRAKDLISLFGRGRKGPGPSTSNSDAAFASLSASS